MNNLTKTKTKEKQTETKSKHCGVNSADLRVEEDDIAILLKQNEKQKLQIP